MIEFISHEACPEDPYIKEIVYLQIDPKCHIAYVRKPMKNGGLFWSPMSSAVVKNGSKKYIISIEIDSNSFKKQILEFLDARSWENNQCKAAVHQNNYDMKVTPLVQHAPPEQMSFLHTCHF